MLTLLKPSIPEDMTVPPEAGQIADFILQDCLEPYVARDGILSCESTLVDISMLKERAALAGQKE